jgi:hypothetical protein
MRLRAIRNHFTGGGWSRSLAAASAASLASVLRPRQIFEAIGQALAPLSTGRLDKQLRCQGVKRCDDQEMIMALPERGSEDVRRAA